MDKNNDIQVNKVSKWDKDIAEESLWQAKKSVDAFLCGYSPMLSIEALDAVKTIYVYLDEALDRFNELEARHQKDTGIISEYEEENRKLKSELDIRTDECDDLISRVLRQDVEYAKIEAEHKKLQETHELCMKAHLRLCDDSTKLATENEEVKKENDNLKQTLLNILEKLETKVGLCRIHPLDSYEDRANLIMVEHDKLLIKCEKLKEENNNLTTDAKRLSDAVNAWFNMFNDMRHKRDDLKKENKKLEEALNDKNKLIYKLTPRKGNIGDKIVPPTGCCGCCNICKQRDICWILND